METPTKNVAVSTPAKANQLIISDISTRDVATKFHEGAGTVTVGAGRVRYVIEISTMRFVEDCLRLFDAY